MNRVLYIFLMILSMEKGVVGVVEGGLSRLGVQWAMPRALTSPGKWGFSAVITLRELCLTGSPYRFTNTVRLSSNECMSWTALHGARSRMKVDACAGGTHFHIRQWGCWQSKAREPTSLQYRGLVTLDVSNTCLSEFRTESIWTSIW
jgi:hypothetical protein